MRTTIRNLLLAGALVAGGIFAGHAIASGVPSTSPLTWSGVVTDDAGKPYAKAVPVTVAFYDGQNATTAACTSATVQAQAGTGYFEVVLPAECVKAVHDSADLWSEMTVGDGKTVLPRSRVGAVPYALEAGVANQATGATGPLQANLDAIQASVKVLESEKPTAKQLVGMKLGSVYEVPFSGGLLVTQLSGALSCDGPTSVKIMIDGKPIHIEGLSGEGTYSYSFSGMQVASGVTPGKHNVSLDSDGKNCSCKAQSCRFVILEL